MDYIQYSTKRRKLLNKIREDFPLLCAYLDDEYINLTRIAQVINYPNYKAFTLKDLLDAQISVTSTKESTQKNLKMMMKQLDDIEKFIYDNRELEEFWVL